MGNLAKSCTHFEAAMQAKSGNQRLKAYYANEIGTTYAINQQQDKAIDWWQRSKQLDPGFILATMNLAHFYEESGELSLAESLFNEAQQQAPTDPRTYYSLARIYSKLGDWPKALNQYQYQLTTDPEDPWCHCNIATCYLQLENQASAMTHFEQAAHLKPDSEAASYANLILVELSLG
jgi:tetratricopeptide (TPR) repeat protein